MDSYAPSLYSPNINLFRDPRWGRGMETRGEEPYLTARLGIAFVQGAQQRLLPALGPKNAYE